MKKYILEVKKSPRDDRDFRVGSIYSSPVVLPTTLDLRSKLPPIRDQGLQGSCSAQTAACMKEWQENIDVGFTDHMSPQFIYNLRENAGEYGMYPRDTMKILQREGIVPEADYPYESMEEISETLLSQAAKYQIMGYARIYSVAELKKALVANGPCYIAFPVYNWETYFWQKFSGDEMMGGHAVTVVGYTKDSFIIRNSWGSDWGFDGYTFYSFENWGAHWEAWTTIDADTNPAPEPEPEPEPEPIFDPDFVPPIDPPDPIDDDAEKKKKDLEDDLKKKANDNLSFFQKLFFCFNRKY